MRHRFFYLTLFLASTLALGWQSLLADPVWEVNPTGNTGALKAQVQTAGSYDAHSGNATRMVNDLQIPGALGDYGLDFTRYWNSVHNDYDDDHADWSLDFGMSGWSHSWHWTASYGEDGPHEVLGTDHDDGKYITSITITFPDGHTTKFKIQRCGPGPSVCPVYNPSYGPPYNYSERIGAANWPYGGPGVNDHICDMDPNGVEFWLCRADGGSVHFVDEGSGYQAREVFDPHGFKTELKYDVNGHLYEVRQEGGRFLEIEWAWYANSGWAIKQVKPGGSDDSKAVTYGYTLLGSYFVLGTVTYPRESWEVQTATAVYYYGGCFVDGIHGECSAPSIWFPLLKRANDPHYAGPMTVIRYEYRGVGCQTPPPPPPNHPPGWFNEHVQAQPYAISAEKSDAGVLVSGFQIYCDSGERFESNGLGGQRKFHYGRAAHTVPPGVLPRGYSLGKVTDFTTTTSLLVPHNSETQPCPQGVSCQRQNFYFSTLPFQIWDGHNNMIEQFVDTRDESGEPVRIEYPGGGNRTYNRIDATGSASVDQTRIHNPYNHWLFSQKDENGNYTAYRRDERRRVTRIEYPGSVEEYSYNDLNQVLTHTLPSGAVQHYEYDGETHFLKREWNSIDGPDEDTKYTHDDLGRVATVQNPRARANGKDFSTRMTYNGQHQIVMVEYAGMNDSSDNPPKVQYEYDTYGNCTAIIDELGHRKNYTYDSYRRCTSLTEELNAPEWNGNGTVYSRQWLWYYDRVIDNDPVPKSASAHTSKEWRVQIEPVFNEAGERRVTTRTFDVNNRMTSETTGLIQPPNQPIGQWVASPGNVETHSFTYDENGQKQSYKDPLGRITDYTYDVRNRPKDVIEPKRNDQPNRPTTTTEYDFAGNKTKVTFPDGKTQRWEGHDAYGQPARYFDEFNKPTDLTYQWGPMKKIDTVRTYRTMDGGAGLEEQKTDFDYDGMGRPRLTTFPDGTTELTAYRFGQVDAFKTRKDQTKRLHYDPRGREDYHTWDSDAAPRIDRVWDPANRLLTISNLFSVIHYGYDDASQVRWEQNSVTGANGPAQLNYLRYPSGEVAHVQYPNGTWIRRNYTPRGQLKDVGWDSGSTSYVYLPDGKVDYQARTNHITTKYGYDGRGMISSVRHKSDDAGYDLARRDYWRDDRDRIKAWEKGINLGVNPRENGRGDRYEYDDAGQLTQAAYQAENAHDAAGTAERTDSFHYDEMGNRTGANWVASRGLMNFGGRNNKLNQYGSWENNILWPDPLHWGLILWYDDAAPHPAAAPWLPPGNGVLMGDGWNVAGFNALNQPVQMTSFFYEGTGNWMWFGYDPLGRCVKRWVGPGDGSAPYGATYLYYDGWNLVQEGLSANSVARTYVHGARVDEIAASAAGGGPWLYHQYDARGHCIMLTNGSGGIVEQYEYDAFGQPYIYDADGALVARNLGSPVGNRFLFTGREWLKELRVYDYRNRLYQPELGRFVQPDPKQFAAGDYNLYRYCHNDPVNRADPMGLSPESQAFYTNVGAAIGFLLSLPVDAGEDLATAGVGVLANPATTIAMTAAGGAAGAALDHLINGNPSRNFANQEGNRSPQAKANNPNSDTSRAVARFEKQKLGQQMKEYKNLEKTFKEHLKKYGQEAGATKGEVNRIERQLEQYRKILEDRGAISK